jgi:hypothetical protein
MAIEGDYIEYEPDGSREVAERLFPFAMSENGEYLAWRLPEEPPPAGTHPEYPIYSIAARMAAIKYGAADLDDLFRRLTTSGVKQILGPGYKPLPATFQPL